MFLEVRSIFPFPLHASLWFLALWLHAVLEEPAHTHCPYPHTAALPRTDNAVHAQQGTRAKFKERFIFLIRNGRLLSCKVTADIPSRTLGGRFKFTLADNQLKVKNTKLPTAISLKSFLSKGDCPCLELRKKRKKEKIGIETVPRRQCLLWFYYFSIPHLFQTNLVRCRCINLLCFGFFLGLIIL